MSQTKKKHAAELRATAGECERRGYPTIAAVNYEEAMWIDPPPRVPREVRERQERKPAPVTDIATARKRPTLPVNVRKAS